MGLFSFKIKSKNKINNKLKIGLALAGGGAKGVCHIGVIRAFEEAGIKFDYIVGTSAGSLVGSAFASGKTSEEMEKFANGLNVKDIRKNKIFFMPSKTDGIENLVKELIGGDLNFSDLKTKLFVVSVCLNDGKETIFSEGKVAKCVAASCCAPGFFVPVNINDKNYVDGGLLNNIPTSVLRDLYCDVIIAVDLGAGKQIGTDSIKTIDTILSSFKIMASLNGDLGKQLADVVIKPDLNKFKSTKLENAKILIDEGYLSAKEKMPYILSLLKHKKPINIKKFLKLKKIENKKHKKQLKQKDKFDVYKKKTI